MVSMAQYGTKEYIEEEIKQDEIEKTILLNALINIVERQPSNLELIEIVASKISNKATSIKWNKESLEKIYENENKEN